MRLLNKLRLRRFATVFTLILLCLVTVFGNSNAAFAGVLSDINGGTPFFDPSSLCSAGGSSSASPSSTPGNGAPNGAAFPNLSPTAMASAINTWITQQNSSSELSGLGSTIVASAQNANVSPFLIVSIAHEESSLASPTDYNVIHGNNPFGRSAASGQPSFQGSMLWYKWSSVEASVDYTAPENQGAAGGGDEATYIRDRFGSNIDSNDLVGLMEAYAPPQANNTAQYIANIQTWVSQLIALTTGTPASSTSSTTTSSSSSSTGCSCPSSSADNSTSDSASPSSEIDLTDAQTFAIASGLQVGIAVSDSSGNIIANYNGDVQNYGASITKVLLLIAALDQAGNTNPTGAENATLTAMIESSDDPSANAIFSQVGAAAVQQVATQAGMTNFVLDTSDPLYTLGQSKVTANDMAKLFGQLNTLIPASQLSYAQNLLSHLVSGDQWGLLSDSVPGVIYSKAGWKQEPPSNNWVLNQGAQITPPGGGAAQTLGIAVLTFGSTSQAAGETLLQNIYQKLLSPILNSGSCASGGGGIVQTALSLAWPTPFTSPTANRSTAITPTANYVAALQKFNPSEFSATGGTGDDCGVFVATVMRDSGADPNYPVVSTITQANYVISHPNLYTVTYPATSTAQLQPGDILILNTGTTDVNGTIHVGDEGAGAGGHTFIYLGPQPGGYNEASASLGDRTANLGVAQLTDSRGQYLIATPKGS